MNLPSPAIVPERGAQRLPRLALLVFCAAYVLPGLFGRAPWRNADLVSFGFMAKIASGASAWLHPSLGGLPADGGLLPYWVGALAIKALPFLDAAQAARLPFGLILIAVMALVWYSSFYLALTEAAQPVAFAFGGEAPAVDYARALADGALLALMASLGLLLLGHEITPELVQLLGMALFVYSLAATAFKTLRARAAMLLSLPMLAASAAPAIAVMLGLGGLLICARSSSEAVRKSLPWMALSLLLACGCGALMHTWAWRVEISSPAALAFEMLELLLWFGWPAWPLAGWTLWRWRAYWQRRHVCVPLLAVVVATVSSVAMGASHQALLLGLPALAVLASFALPTFSRSMAAMVDWYSVFFFTACALFVWVYYLSMQTQWPAQPLANVQRLVTGFQPSFGPIALLLGSAGTIAWLALVRWRTARHQHALWKSMVLPAGGVALCWLLSTTLMLPGVDFALSNRSLVQALRAHLPAQVSCVAAPGQALSLLASLEVEGGWPTDARNAAVRSDCPYLIVQMDDSDTSQPAGDWEAMARVKRPTDRQLSYRLYRRVATR